MALNVISVHVHNLCVLRGGRGGLNNTSEKQLTQEESSVIYLFFLV